MVRKSDLADRAARRMNTIMVAAGIAALLIGMGLSITLTNRVLRPLGVLEQAVKRVGEGDLAARASIASKDEIGKLASEFNAMAARLEQYRSSSLGELLQAQQASQAAIDSLADPVIVFGIEGEILNVNGAAESILGLNIERGENPLARLDPAARAVLESVRAHVLGGKGAYSPKGFEEAFRVHAPDGDHYLLPRATPVYQEGGGIVGATLVLQDVTRLRRFDELKNDLVATVAHEFRTPLTSLRMAIHLCIEQAVGPLTEKQSDLLYAAREDCERMQSIVDDLLNLSRIQAGRFEVHPQPVSALSLVKTAVNTYRGPAEDRGIQLESHFFDDPGPVLADPERIQLVFTNLVTNAIRHTPKGGTVELKMESVDSIVKFEVSDQGEGIPEEHQRKIFDKFFQVPGATHEGAGLGLAIAKEIVLAHRGEIGVKSAPGQGSTFWFTLPRSR
jgi:PAS domain S-box-containing protein